MILADTGGCLLIGGPAGAAVRSRAATAHDVSSHHQISSSVTAKPVN